MDPRPWQAMDKGFALGEVSGKQQWGTTANSGYFKFLRLKLRIVELALMHGVDVIMTDVRLQGSIPP